MVKPQSEPGAASKASGAARQRKWHSRVFTGCVNCRRRHVKCDEGTPACSNCTRLSLPCNFDRKFVFKAVKTATGPPLTPYSDKLSPSSSERRISSRSGSTSSSDEMAEEIDGGKLGTNEIVAFRASGKPGPHGSHGIFFISEDFLWKDSSFGGLPKIAQTHTFVPEVPQHIDSNDNLYLQHFLETVSTYLIIYDTPSNSNPYRQLPALMGNSGLLREVMKALGAMHIAGLPQTRDRQTHRSAAMRSYGNAVTWLRDAVAAQQGQPSLELLATTLLLCMFEKMSSDDSSWKIHLIGAGQIFQSLYSPRTILPAGRSAHGSKDVVSVSNNLPLRRFLVSLMAYLDVAGSCATGEGPLIPGDYWETFGGGWEYNLGAPSFAKARSPSDRVMGQIRHSWSRMMSIQTEISKFARLDRMGMPQDQRDLYYNDLSYRINNWQDVCPDIFLRVEKLNTMPEGVTPEEHETLTAAACIQTYGLACSLYLERVKTRQVGNARADPAIAAAVDRTLTLIFNFQFGINQLAVLWPLLTAGIATNDPIQQGQIRERLCSMKGFGFKHITRVLTTLEYIWDQVRLHGGMDYDEFEKLLSSNLVP